MFIKIIISYHYHYIYHYTITPIVKNTRHGFCLLLLLPAGVHAPVVRPEVADGEDGRLARHPEVGPVAEGGRLGPKVGVVRVAGARVVAVQRER